MEAIASVAPGLCLGALSKVPIEIYKFLIEVPFTKEKLPCPFKYEVSGLHAYQLWGITGKIIRKVNQSVSHFNPGQSFSSQNVY